MADAEIRIRARDHGLREIDHLDFVPVALSPLEEPTHRIHFLLRRGSELGNLAFRRQSS